MPERTYLAIDLKSFYASVECIERGLNPMTTNLVVADASRTEKTICLAVSPSLKSYGIPGRPRLFEVLQKVKEINLRRAQRAPGHRLTGSSSDNEQLKISPELGLDFIVAPPRMAHYMQVSTKIYDIYLKYIAPEDIHVYSIDEVLIDVTGYLQTYRLSAYDLAMKMILDVVRTTGITATAGIGPNLYLAKVALDIGAKHIQPDENGVRIACLDEMSYRRTLWTHRPLTDFWRVGRGYARKLEAHGMCTMGDIARCSIGKPSDYYNEDFLYKMFGVNAELLIDHAWGWEPCTIADIKAYEQYRFRAGPLLPLFLPDGPPGGARDGRFAGAGAGGPASCHRSAGADHRLRHREPQRPAAPQAVSWAGERRPLWPRHPQAHHRHRPSGLHLLRPQNCRGGARVV